MRTIVLLLIFTLISIAFPRFTAGVQSKQGLYFIGGHLLDSNGTPACGFRVCAFSEDFDPAKPNVTVPCAISNARGEFSFAVSKPGRYKLFSDHLHNGYWPQQHPFLRDPTLPITEVIVDPNLPRTPITIYHARKNGLLVGRSVDTRTGQPVDNVHFVLCLIANPEICRTTESKHSDGEFRVAAPFAPFTFKAKSTGFKDWLGPRGEELVPINVVPGTTTQLNVLLIRQSDDGSPVTEAEKLDGLHLPAPSQVAPEDGATYNHYPRSTKLEWSPVDGAVSYSVEIDYCRGVREKRECVDPHLLTIKSNPSMHGLVGTEYQFLFVGAQPGRWRVWATDKDGREGFKSPWRLFFYLK